MYSSIATRDVDLPDHVGHVTRYSHFLAFNTFFLILSAMSLNMRSSICLGSLYIFLITTAISPVLKYAFTLYDVPDLDVKAKSLSLFHRKLSNL